MINFQTREWTFDVAATGTVRNISSTFDIATLIIQNPSAMWLYLPAMRQYVPPQSLGVVIPIIPTSKSININYVTAPTGGLPSAVTGGPIIVDAYSTEMAAYQGLDYGLDQSIAGLNALLTTTNTLLTTLNTSIGVLDASIEGLQAGWGSGSTRLGTRAIIASDNLDNLVLAAPGPGLSIVVDAFIVAPYWAADYDQRGTVTTYLTDGITIYPEIATTPENPTGQLIIPPGAIKCAVNTALYASANSVGLVDNSGSVAWLAVYVEYHLV